MPAGGPTDRPPPNTSASGVAPDTLIPELTTADKAAWCTWYRDSWIPSSAPPNNPLRDGHAVGGRTIGCAEEGPHCVQQLSIENCASNLTRSTCTATLGQLEECVRTLLNRCDLVGQGCAQLAGCGCHDTIVQVGELSPLSLCEVPVH